MVKSNLPDKKLRVGFDLDGVVIYNPTRIIRPITAFFKDLIFKEKHLRFYHPKSKLGRLIWWFLHKSSLYISPGFWDLTRLVHEGKMEVFIVTARYDFLKSDFEKWIKKLNKNKTLSGWYFNKKNEKPHIFKARMIKKLELDIFVDDNLDIANFLKTKFENRGTKIFWVYNILDRKQKYQYKFSKLNEVVKKLYRLIYKNKKKLLIVTDYFYPHWTGFSKAIYSMTQILKNQYVITILTVQHDKKLKKIEFLNGLLIIRCRYLFSISRSKYSIGIIYNFFKEIQSNDKVLINAPSANIFFYSLIMKAFHKKLIVYHHAHLLLPKSFWNNLLQKTFEFLTTSAYLLVDKIGTHSLDYARYTPLLRPYLKKIEPVLIPVSINQLAVDIKTVIKLQGLKKKDAVFMGFAGRFVYEKGFDLLLKSIPEIISKNPKVKFVFAGMTNIYYESFFQQHRGLWNKYKRHIINLGFLNEQELMAFYKVIDYIIIPSRIDSFNMIQAEAALNGVPIIASNIPGLRFLIQKTGFGLLFKKESIADLVLKIEVALKNRDNLMKNYPKVKDFLDKKVLSKKLRDFIY